MMDAQIEREAERAKVLTRLADARERDTAYCRKRDALEAEIREKRRELARHLETFNSYTLEKLEAQLRSLADPAISQAISETISLGRKAESAYKTTSVLEKRVSGTRRRTVSNALEIADVLASIKATRGEFEALLTAPKPDDLDAHLAAKLEPLRLAVSRLNGF